jgi:hypothetical protein
MQLFKIASALVCAAGLTAFSQGVRYDHKVSTVATNVPFGANAPVLAIPNATITICADGNCAAKASIFSNQGLTVTTGNPMKSDGQGNFGFWAAAGTYFYMVQTPSGNTLGIFPITLGGSSGGATTLANVAAGVSQAGVYDFSAATHLKVPIHAGYTAPAPGEIGYDSTNGNLHTNYVGADLIIAGFPSASLPTSGHCAKFTLIGQWWELDDAGAPCGGGSGSGTVVSGLALSPAYYTANGTVVGGVTPFTGLGFWSTSAAPRAAASSDVTALLATDTVNNSAYGFATGSGGDTTCPTPVSGKDFLCMKAGVMSYSHSGAAYVAFVNGGSSGAGTVTAVSVVTANGVSGTVANPTTTPAITLSLGAITPTSVATGSVSATGGSAASAGTPGVYMGSSGGAHSVVSMSDSGGGTDGNLWDFLTLGATLNGRAVNDAQSAANNWITVSRSGTTITGIAFGAPITAPNFQQFAGVPSGSCAVGSLATNTAATSTGTVLYVCFPANTWTAK